MGKTHSEAERNLVCGAPQPSPPSSYTYSPPWCPTTARPGRESSPPDPKPPVQRLEIRDVTGSSAALPSSVPATCLPPVCWSWNPVALQQSRLEGNDLTSMSPSVHMGLSYSSVLLDWNQKFVFVCDKVQLCWASPRAWAGEIWQHRVLWS